MAFFQFYPVKRVRFDDDDLPQRSADNRHHHHHHHHHRHLDPYLHIKQPTHHARCHCDGCERERHDRLPIHHRPHVRRTGPSHKPFSPPPPPPPQCEGCSATFRSSADLDSHRHRKPRHCPQHNVCFSDWKDHCFDYDHIKCPRSSCKHLAPFLNRQDCLDHLRRWHRS